MNFSLPLLACFMSLLSHWDMLFIKAAMLEIQNAKPCVSVEARQFDFWVGSDGGVLTLLGEYQNNKMILTGETQSAGKKIWDRITWHNNVDHTVRQVWDRSEDDGKTWSNSFDGLYTKKK